MYMVLILDCYSCCAFMKEIVFVVVEKVRYLCAFDLNKCLKQIN